MAHSVKAKYVSESQTDQVQVVMPPHLNGYGNLFGGQLAKWIDMLAGVVARRHCGMAITTAAIDNLRFREPVRQNDMVVLRGRITHVGTTSMEVRVDSYAEDAAGARRLINTAFVIMVALDDKGRPSKVPALLAATPEEEREYQAGARRREMRHRIYKDLYE